MKNVFEGLIFNLTQVRKKLFNLKKGHQKLPNEIKGTEVKNIGTVHLRTVKKDKIFYNAYFRIQGEQGTRRNI